MVSPRHAQDRFITVNNIKLHYLDWGNKDLPAVILLHGLTGGAHDWDYLLGYLEERYRCLAVDMCGHGDSQWADTSHYNTQDFATDIALFVDGLGLDKVCMVGRSLGGIVAPLYVASHPEKVARLIIVDISPDIDAQAMPTLREALTNIKNEFGSYEEVMDYLRKRSPLAQNEMLRHVATFTTKKLPDGKLTWKHDPQVEDTFFKSILEGKANAGMQLIARIKCPTLIMRGAESTTLSHKTAQKMESLMPQAELVEIEGSGHSIFLDQPELFNQAIARFLMHEE